MKYKIMIENAITEQTSKVAAFASLGDALICVRALRANNKTNYLFYFIK